MQLHYCEAAMGEASKGVMVGVEEGGRAKGKEEEEEEREGGGGGGGGHVGVAWNARGPRTVLVRRVYLLQPTYRSFHSDYTFHICVTSLFHRRKSPQIKDPLTSSPEFISFFNYDLEAKISFGT